MDESYQNLLAAGVEAKYRALEMSIMDDIIRRIQKAGRITDAADWQIQRLVILGNSTQDIEDLIRRAVGGNEEEVRRLYAEVIEREYTRDRSLYEQIGKEFIPYELNPELQQITDALVKQSTEELYNITKSTGFMLENGSGRKIFTPLSDVYNRYLDDAITGMANGAYDYNTLVRRLVSQKYVRVELFNPIGETSESAAEYTARQFTVANEVSENSGAGGEKISVTGTLHAVGDPVLGKFDTVAKKFTAGDFKGKYDTAAAG